MMLPYHRRKSMQMGVVLTLLVSHVISEGVQKTVYRNMPENTLPRKATEITLANLSRSSADWSWFQREKENLLRNPEGEDLTQLFADLKQGQSPLGMSPGQWHAAVNEIFSSLTNDTQLDVNLEPMLITIVREAKDTTVRDYALQHSAILAKDPNARDSRAILWEAAGWKELSIAGTALLNLYHLDEGVEDGTLAEAALAVANDPAALEATRSTALQVGILLEDERFLEPAVQLASRTHIVAHRVSALRVLASYAGPEHKTLLLTLRRKGPQPATDLANQALTRIDHEKN